MARSGNSSVQNEILEDHIGNFMKHFMVEAEMKLSMVNVQNFTITPTASLYFEPLLLVMYIFFAVFVFIIFRKLKMIGFVQNVLLLSYVSQITPYLINTPLFVVFSYSAKGDAPMPYPWCYIYYFVFEGGVKVTRLADLYLRVLLSINRCCAVYFPFQTKIWFSRSRQILLPVFVYILVTTIGIGLSFSTTEIDTKYVFEDIWTKGDFTVYLGCSTAKILRETPNVSMTFVVYLIQHSLLLLGSFVLIILNVTTIVVIKRKEDMRRDLIAVIGNTRSAQNIFMLTKIVTRILFVSLAIDLPFLAVDLISFYWITVGMFKGVKYVTDSHVLAYISSLGSFIAIPSDLIMFLLFSRKARNGIRLLFCKNIT